MSKYLKQSIWVVAFVFLTVFLQTVSIEPRFEVTKVQAGNTHNMHGFAWSSNIGWISFNSKDCDINGDGQFGDTNSPLGCPTSGVATDYGVNLDAEVGGYRNMTGYAWSPNIGYIKFGGIDVSTMPTGPGTTAVNARVGATQQTSIGSVTGWVRACSVYTTGCSGSLKSDLLRGGWDGWVSLKGNTQDGGTYDSIMTGGGGGISNDLWGVAWGGDVVGWVFFNSSDSRSEGGNYKVYSDDSLFARLYLSTNGGRGSVSTNDTKNGGYTIGDTVTVSATTYPGGSFIDWTDSSPSGNNAYVTSTSPYTFTITKDTYLRGNFTGTNGFNLSVSGTGGTESISGTTTTSGVFPFNTQQRVIAVPGSGNGFIDWTDGGVRVSTSSSYTFILNNDRSLIANYSTNLSVSSGIGGTASISGTSTKSGLFPINQNITVSATPSSSKYAFSNWTEGSTVVSNSASYTFKLNSARSLVANFIKITACSDGIGNDTDKDGINDDGYIDYNGGVYPYDPGCISSGDTSEANLITECSDKIDNDLDGLIDFYDSDTNGGKCHNPDGSWNWQGTTEGLLKQIDVDLKVKTGLGIAKDVGFVADAYNNTPVTFSWTINPYQSTTTCSFIIDEGNAVSGWTNHQAVVANPNQTINSSASFDLVGSNSNPFKTSTFKLSCQNEIGVTNSDSIKIIGKDDKEI